MRAHLCDTRSGKHARYPVDEPVLPGRVEASPAGTSLSKVVLLGNAHLLAVARHLHVLIRVLLRVPHRVKPRWEVVYLHITRG